MATKVLASRELPVVQGTNVLVVVVEAVPVRSHNRKGSHARSYSTTTSSTVASTNTSTTTRVAS